MKGFADIRRLRLHYEAAGNGPATIFLHGHFLDLRMWEPAFKAVAARYRAVRYDLRGHGQTEMPLERYTHAQDLHDLLEYLGVTSACLVGHSLGASVAVEYALAHPERVRGLVCVAPYIPDQSLSAPHRQRLDRYAAVARQHGPARARRLWLEKEPLLDAIRSKPRLHARMAELIGHFNFTEAIRPALQLEAGAPAAHLLPRIGVPARIVVGEREADDIRRIARTLYGGIPNARITVIPESGHWPPIEQPEAFNWVLLDFLGSLE
jgi:3-oxoadipate enol-lactonase